MLIVPLHKRPDWAHFPAITLLIFLANLVVYFELQSEDLALEEAAAAFWHEQLRDTESPAYMAYLEQTQPDLVDAVQAADEQTRPELIRQLINQSPAFQTWLANDHSQWPRRTFRDWQADRATYEQMLSHSSTLSWRLPMIDPSVSQWLGHMFLHADAFHLLGNMLFLVLLGVLVEAVLPTLIYALSYLVCGLVAAALMMWSSDTSIGGMVGASGAIAGLMGLYAVLWGRRKVRFFYWALVYFDYGRLPAWVLLPIWLGWELLMAFGNDGSAVAYEAHAGGLVAGAALGWLWTRLGWIDTTYLDDNATGEEALDLVQQARNALTQAHPARAVEHLETHIASHPCDVEAWRLLLRTTALKPTDPALHDVMERLALIECRDEPWDAMVADCFQAYLQACQRSKPRLSGKATLALARRFVRSNHLAPAMLLVTAMQSRNRDHPAVKGLRRALTVKLDALDRADEANAFR